MELEHTCDTCQGVWLCQNLSRFPTPAFLYYPRCVFSASHNTSYATANINSHTGIQCDVIVVLIKTANRGICNIILISTAGIVMLMLNRDSCAWVCTCIQSLQTKLNIIYYTIQKIPIYLYIYIYIYTLNTMSLHIIIRSYFHLSEFAGLCWYELCMSFNHFNCFVDLL